MNTCRSIGRRFYRTCTGRDDGSAIVEFSFFGVLVTVPIFYLIMALARVHAGSYAVSAAAREAGRTFVSAPSESAASGRSRTAAAIAFADQGFPGQGTVSVQCSRRPCLTRDASVRVQSRLEVPLPFVPAAMQEVIPARITLSAEHRESVDRFGG